MEHPYFATLPTPCPPQDLPIPAGVVIPPKPTVTDKSHLDSKMDAMITDSNTDRGNDNIVSNDSVGRFDTAGVPLSKKLRLN